VSRSAAVPCPVPAVATVRAGRRTTLRQAAGAVNSRSCDAGHNFLNPLRGRESSGHHHQVVPRLALAQQQVAAVQELLP
jgi:hypothetical protein